MNYSLRGTLLAALTAVALGGCAHPQLIDYGSHESAVIQKLGAPHARVTLPDGTIRLTYSGQPYEQCVWWLFLDKDGRVMRREQGLQEKFFSLIEIGKSTERDVWNLWGPCAEKYHFALVNEHAWMYRFVADGSFDMAVWPQFDERGIVRSVDVTEDPWKRDVEDFHE